MKYEYKITEELKAFNELGKEGYCLKVQSGCKYIFERELASTPQKELNPLDVIVGSLNSVGVETTTELLESGVIDFTLESVNLNTMVRMTFNKDGYLVGIENKARLKGRQ